MQSLTEIERIMEQDRDRIADISKEVIPQHIRIIIWNRCFSLTTLMVFQVQHSIEEAQHVFV